MLRIDVRELRKGPVDTDGAIAATDPVFAGLGFSLAGPLQVTGLLETTGRGDYLWRGKAGGSVHSTCRRCLAEFVARVETSVEAVFSTDPELQDDPSVYSLTEPVTHVDVTEAIREEFAFAVPQYPLCREDCAGLCPTCGADLNQGPCGCPSPAPKQ